MLLKKLALQNFRSYEQKTFSFNENLTYIVGPNTSGKSNLIESIYLLSSGKSYRSVQDVQMIRFGEKISRAKAVIAGDGDEEQLEVLVAKEDDPTTPPDDDMFLLKKKYFLNGVSRSRVKFAWRLPSLLFVPSDLDIIDGSPGLRRRFLDNVLELVDEEYRRSLIEYVKAIRQRNALLEQARDTGIRNDKQFEYWDDLVIRAGSFLTGKREEFITYINSHPKDVAEVSVTYDKSVISKERLEKYRHAEMGSCVTLVGPHRDDFLVNMKNGDGKKSFDVKAFGSRGQQRLAILQLKLLQLSYIEEKTGSRPLLLLDDIFSELDDGHIKLVMDMVTRQQTIITTTHEEFIHKSANKIASTIRLGEGI
jgi:DNA replication and repair protein RecF